MCNRRGIVICITLTLSMTITQLMCGKLELKRVVRKESLSIPNLIKIMNSYSLYNMNIVSCLFAGRLFTDGGWGGVVR